MANAQTAAQAAQQQNSIARQMLLTLGTPMRKNLGTFGPYNAGDLASIQLTNVGVLTSLDIVVTGEITITTAATVSSQAPFNFIRNLNLLDYTNQSRINCNHLALEMLLAARHHRQQGRNILTDQYDGGSASGAASLLTLPTAVVTPTGPNFRIPAHIPVAYDSQSDLRGAILMQTIRGQMNINVQMPTAAQLFGTVDDCVYTAGAGSVANIYVQVFQNYIMPRGGLNAQTLVPFTDLSTVYEINSQGQSTSDLAAGGVKYINYPNVRQVLSAVLRYNNGSATAGDAYTYATDVTSIIVNANANTNLREYAGLDLLDRMRTIFGGEILPGSYYLDSRKNPINTQLYGQVQVQFTPKTVNSSSAYTELTVEDFYLKGTALPGISFG